MEDVDGDFLIENVNVTSLVTNGGTLIKRVCHASFFQEHTVPQILAGTWHRTFRDAKMTLLGPADPEHNKHSAGVGAACREPHIFVMLDGKSDIFRDA